jgi:hypothetical protein
MSATEENERLLEIVHAFAAKENSSAQANENSNSSAQANAKSNCVPGGAKTNGNALTNVSAQENGGTQMSGSSAQTTASSVHVVCDAQSSRQAYLDAAIPDSMRMPLWIPGGNSGADGGAGGGGSDQGDSSSGGGYVGAHDAPSCAVPCFNASNIASSGTCDGVDTVVGVGGDGMLIEWRNRGYLVIELPGHTARAVTRAYDEAEAFFNLPAEEKALCTDSTEEYLVSRLVGCTSMQPVASAVVQCSQ